jgi:hypothetical protein
MGRLRPSLGLVTASAALLLGACGMPAVAGRRSDKSLWWREGYDWRTETSPRLLVTGHFGDERLRFVVRVR